ncbi:hypothetical protein JAK51_11675 [Stenotrophomonas maltophilia]|uniref:hypothetical protein n=1 Tax=Stenotrophomonas maltophilia TaxID=40324 RepID=UPI0021C753D5|nr:hypothetical protein [Stenotrophomonas maltophilia]MCU1126875.1 hypothetical protein [Stenotrophomonas maltophilia]
MTQRNVRAGLLLAYIMLLALLASTPWIWQKWSPGGFAAPGPFFCKELLSSGGDDDVMIMAFIVFALPLVLRVIRLLCRVGVYEVWLFYICVAFVGFSLMLASLDCADVFYTAFVLPDPALAAALLAIPVAALVLAYLRAKSRPTAR